MEINIQLFKDRDFFKGFWRTCDSYGACGFSVCECLLAVLPLLSVHMVVILYVVSRLHLNKVMALLFRIFACPVCASAPLSLAIICSMGVDYEVSLRVILWQLKDRVWEWLIGSLIVAPLLAAVVAVIVFLYLLVL